MVDNEMNWKVRELGVNITKLEGAFDRIESLLESLRSGCIDKQSTIIGVRAQLNHQRFHLLRLKEMFGLK